MPEEKATINQGSADLSGPDEATKEKISESVLARAKKNALEFQQKAKDNFLTSPQETLYKNLKKDRLEGEADRKKFYDQKRGLADSIESDEGDASQNASAEGGVNKVAPDKFGEGRKQYIQSSEMERRGKKLQANKEKSPLNIKKRPQALVRQMASLQASRNIALREGVREIREGNKVEDNNSQEDIGENEKDSRLKIDKQSVKSDQKASLKTEQIDKSGSSEIKLATDNLLKSMIRMVVPSWSLSMFYVYLHVFLRSIFPDYFSKLGHEWVPANIKKSNPNEAAKIGDRIGIAEKPAVGCCCVFHLFIIIIIVAIIYFILNPWGVVWDFLYSIARAAWEGVKGWLGLGD